MRLAVLVTFRNFSRLALATFIAFVILIPTARDGSTAPSRQVSGRLPGTPNVQVQLVQQLDLDGDGQPDVTVIDCSFATARDRVLVVDGGHNMVDSTSWEEATDFVDDTWIFDVGSTGRAKLIIRFSQEDGHDVAYLYDDQDGDGFVSYSLDRGTVLVTESEHWSIKLVSSSRWFNEDGSLNLNMTFLSDGVVVQVSPRGTEVADGVVDAIVEERTYSDGNPWYELRYIVGASRSDQALSRSAIRVTNLHMFPSPPVGYTFFPLLGSAAWYADHYWFDTPPTVTMDWALGRIGDTGIIGYPIRQGYYVNGPYYFRKGQANLMGFENPQADYRMAGPPGPSTDPDVHIRIAYIAPNEPWSANGATPLEQVSYDWRQHDSSDLTWDYKIDVAGTNELTDVEHFPEFDLIVPPYEQLPYWVMDNNWAYGTFLAVEQGAYRSTEGIYEWYTIEGIANDQRLGTFVPDATHQQRLYLIGDLGQSPSQLYQQIRPGMRGEYADMNGKVQLYFSAIDHRLHLASASHGVWNVTGNGREVRYSSLGGDYLDHWSLQEAGEEIGSLVQAADQLIYADASGVWLRTIDVQPLLFTALPPRNHDEWVRLGSLLEQHKANFAGDDLRAMFDQFVSPVQMLPGDAMRDFRRTPDGFRFAFDLKSEPVGVSWAAGLNADSYLVQYRMGDGYSISPLRAADLDIAPVVLRTEQVTALNPVELSVVVRNRGGEGVYAVPISVSVMTPDSRVLPIGSMPVDVPGGETAEVTFSWTPPRAGEWVLQAAAAEMSAVSAPVEVQVQPPPATDIVSVVAAQGLWVPLTVAIGAVLSTATLLAGVSGLGLWPGPDAVQADSTAVEHRDE